MRTRGTEAGRGTGPGTSTLRVAVPTDWPLASTGCIELTRKTTHRRAFLAGPPRGPSRAHARQAPRPRPSCRTPNTPRLSPHVSGGPPCMFSTGPAQGEAWTPRHFVPDTAACHLQGAACSTSTAAWSPGPAPPPSASSGFSQATPDVLFQLGGDQGAHIVFARPV